MSVNRRNIEKLSKQLGDEFAKYPIRIPIEAMMPETRLPRLQIDALLRILYDRRAFGTDRMGVKEAADAAGLGMDLEGAKKVYNMAFEEGLVGPMGLAGSAHLTSKGRRYVESLDEAGPASPSTMIFNGTINNGQFAFGDNSVQNQTNSVVDVGQLTKLVTMVSSFDTTELSDTDRVDLVQDISVIEAQLADPSGRDPGLNRALRSIKAIVVNAAGSALGGAIAALATSQMI